MMAASIFQPGSKCNPGIRKSSTIWEQLYEHEKKYASTHLNLIAQVFITGGSLENDFSNQWNH